MDIGHCSCSCSSSSSPHIWLGLAAAKWIYSAADRPTDRPDHRENDIRCLWHRCLQNFMECALLLLLLLLHSTEELTTNSWDYDISNSSALSSVIEVTVGDVCKFNSEQWFLWTFSVTKWTDKFYLFNVQVSLSRLLFFPSNGYNLHFCRHIQPALWNANANALLIMRGWDHNSPAVLC